MMIDAPAEAQTSAKDPFIWFENFEGCANTWALAGCFYVSFQDTGDTAAKQILYVHRSDAYGYFRVFKKKFQELRRTFSDASALAYLAAVEQKIRAKAIDLARSNLKIPFGIALTRALLMESTAWQMEATVLRYPEPPPNSRRETRVETPAGPKGGGKSSVDTPSTSKNSNANGPQKTSARATHIDGKEICPFYQTPKKGCTNKKCNKQHVCNKILISSGKACGGSHPACRHNKQRDGEFRMEN